MPDNSSPTPPRGERFSDDGAKVVWAALRALDEALQHEILAALRERLAVAEDRDTPQAARIARAVAALREAADLLERATGSRELSVDTYRQLRVDQPNRGWPPDGSIRRWLGGTWNDALRRARLDEVRDGAATTGTELGSPFTRDEVIAALRAYAAEVDGELSLSSYRFWAKRPDVRRRPGRRPLSQGAFDRLFGGWTAALIAADLIDSEAPARRPRKHGPQVRPTGYGFTTDQIRGALREVAELLGRSPRTSEYTRERARLLDAQHASGKPLRAMPSYNVINDRYLTWDDALVDAGLEPLGGRATRSNPARERKARKRVTTEQMLEAIRRAYEAVGEPFKTTAYMAWRADQIAADPRAARRIPRYDTIAARLACTWADACDQALGDQRG